MFRFSLQFTAIMSQLAIIRISITRTDKITEHVSRLSLAKSRVCLRTHGAFPAALQQNDTSALQCLRDRLVLICYALGRALLRVRTSRLLLSAPLQAVVLLLPSECTTPGLSTASLPPVKQSQHQLCHYGSISETRRLTQVLRWVQECVRAEETKFTARRMK